MKKKMLLFNNRLNANHNLWLQIHCKKGEYNNNNIGSALTAVKKQNKEN